ncbi:MAG: glycine cleavage system protein H [Thermoplasmatales archaeon]|nr:glycine cleavage system protein H [Thermoplasmatales archaeon]
MSEVTLPGDLAYTKTHEWVRVEGNVATIGITDHAQSQLTDIVFVDLPTVGKETKAGTSALVLESVKTVTDVYAPGNGTVSEVNSELMSPPPTPPIEGPPPPTIPTLVGHTPSPRPRGRGPVPPRPGQGWLFKVRLTEPIPAGALLKAEAYHALIESGTH